MGLLFWAAMLYQEGQTWENVSNIILTLLAIGLFFFAEDIFKLRLKYVLKWVALGWLILPLGILEGMVSGFINVCKIARKDIWGK